MRILSDISFIVEIVVSTRAMISCKEDEENRICHDYKGSIQNRQYAKHGNILSHYACIHFLILIHYSIICYVFLNLLRVLNVTYADYIEFYCCLTHYCIVAATWNCIAML